jgi:predicted DsbA family dithiol-disulfide isomerase
MEKLRIQIWSDIACPWCHVGKRRLEAALARFPHHDAVEITWRAFELDPAAPAVREAIPYAQRLGQKYGTSTAQAQGMIDRMTEVARADGLDFRFDRARPGNTFDAHRLIHLAADRGLQDAVKERFLRAYLTEGEAIGDPETLARLASEAGLDRDEATAVLRGDAYAAEVRQDEAEASAHGIRAVPFFVIGRYGVSGAQPAELLLQALHRAWEEQNPSPPAFVEGAACGPDGCA